MGALLCEIPLSSHTYFICHIDSTVWWMCYLLSILFSYLSGSQRNRNAKLVDENITIWEFKQYRCELRVRAREWTPLVHYLNWYTENRSYWTMHTNDGFAFERRFSKRKPPVYVISFICSLFHSLARSLSHSFVSLFIFNRELDFIHYTKAVPIESWHNILSIKYVIWLNSLLFSNCWPANWQLYTFDLLKARTALLLNMRTHTTTTEQTKHLRPDFETVWYSMVTTLHLFTPNLNLKCVCVCVFSVWGSNWWPQYQRTRNPSFFANLSNRFNEFQLNFPYLAQMFGRMPNLPIRLFTARDIYYVSVALLCVRVSGSGGFATGFAIRQAMECGFLFNANQ